ncbi:MAG: TonB-dependent receptor [Planctomycetota bacterium]
MLPLLLAASASAPQEPVPESVVTAPRAEETITHSDALITTIEAGELERSAERSLPQAIEAAAEGGLWLQETNLGGGSAFLRGLTGNRILIVVDGVRVNDGTTRLGPNQSLNGFDPATIERVEVLRGPASVLYGSDAIGGVILMWTKRARPTGKEGAVVSGGAGTQYSTVFDGGSAYADASVRTESQGLFAAATFFDYDDVESADGTVPFTGYDGRGYFGSYEVDLGEERDLRLTASVHRDFDVPRTDKLIPGFGQTEPTHQVFDFALQDRRRFLLAYTDRGEGRFSDRAQVRLSYRTYTEERARRSTGSDTLARERDETETLGLGVDFQKFLGDDHLLTYGLDVELDQVDSTRRDLDVPTGVLTPNDGAFAPNSEYLRSGVFVQDETSFGGFDATLGARYSLYDFSFDAFPSAGGADESGSFDAFTASLQLARQLTDATRLTGTLAQGFRAPNLDDLANRGEFAGGLELNNPDLEPEESLTAELALDHVEERWSAGGAVFATRIEDTIGRELIDEGDPGVSGDETFLRQNVGRVEIYGVEASLRHDLGDAGLGAAYSVTLTRGRQFDDVVDPGDGATDARRIPPLFGRAALEYRPDGQRLGVSWLDVELLWADDQDRLNPQDKADPRIDPDGTPGWGVVNLLLGGDVGDVSWHAGLHNAFDKSYRVHASGFDAPGRGLVFGVDWRP